MQVAKLTSKGQITLPKEVRASLKVKDGDKVVFVKNEYGFTVANASLMALKKIQDAMDGEAEKAGLYSEDDVVAMIKEHRREGNRVVRK